MVVQSVLFKSSVYTLNDCLEWLKSHNYNHNKVDIAKNFYRWRQVPPITLKRKGYLNYRTISLNNGNILLVDAY